MMSSLGEVQRIIGLSLNKIQMGRNQRGGLPLHKNLLVATVLNKARDFYMQETMYMNYRLMACGQFNQQGEHDELEDDDTPDTEDYEEDSESDVEDDGVETGKEFAGTNNPSASNLLSAANSLLKQQQQQQHSITIEPVDNEPTIDVTDTSSSPSSSLSLPSATCPLLTASPAKEADQDQEEEEEEEAEDGNANSMTPPASNVELVPAVASTSNSQVTAGGGSVANSSDEGFIDESDCDCDARNFCQDGENRVPFQYCFNCAPFHPSNGRGPTLVSPQQPSTTCVLAQSVSQESEDKLIYDMDSKSTSRNQTSLQQLAGKRKRHISVEETEDAVNSILLKKRRESVDSPETENLNDSGFQEENELFHPAFRGHTANNGMEVDQITSLVSIFTFGQQLFNNAEQAKNKAAQTVKKKEKDEDDSDSDSDTSSDSGHSSDDHENNSDEKSEENSSSSSSSSSKDLLESVVVPELGGSERLAGGDSSPSSSTKSDQSCSTQAKDIVSGGDHGEVGVTATV